MGLGFLGVKQAFQLALILVAITIPALLLFSVYNGLLEWHRDSYRCLSGSHWYASVPPQRWLSVGSLHLKYQPMTWGCDETHRYDPKQYEMRNGILVPVGEQ